MSDIPKYKKNELVTYLESCAKNKSVCRNERLHCLLLLLLYNLEKYVRFCVICKNCDIGRRKKLVKFHYLNEINLILGDERKYIEYLLRDSSVPIPELQYRVFKEMIGISIDRYISSYQEVYNNDK